MNITKLINEIRKFNNQSQIENTREYCDYMNDIILENITDREYKPIYPNIDDKEKEIIKKVIFESEYPEVLKPLAKQLYDYAGVENMAISATNLPSVKVKKDKKYKIQKFNPINPLLVGIYNGDKNEIEYFEDHVLPFEFMHMATTPIIKNTNSEYTSGFMFDFHNIIFGEGLNEGYNELLTRRIFFDENYNSKSMYKINVYLLRIFELLYDNKEEMEKDYLNANYQSPIGNFIKYGTGEEFFKLTKYLDHFINTDIKFDEDKKMLEFMKKIVKRTNDDKKILLAEEIQEEYLETEKKALKKTFSFTTKRHN